MEDWIERYDSLVKAALSNGKKFLSLFKNIRIFFIAGETVYAAPTKKTTSGGGTLGRRTRRGHASALSSSSTASDRSETVFPDEHTRMHLTNGEKNSAGIPFSRHRVIIISYAWSSHYIACRRIPPLETMYLRNCNYWIATSISN